MARQIAEFKPDVLGFDPWNSLAFDDAQSDYFKAFTVLKSFLHGGPAAPCLTVLAHTRKPKTDAKASGRSLLNALAGSHVLGSRARTVFSLQSASDDGTDDPVICCCAKSNDGELSPPSAWHRGRGAFAPADDFDWEAFKNPAATAREGITAENIRALFWKSTRSLTRSHAAKELQASTSFGKSACYDALKPGSRFAAHLKEDQGLLSWTE